MGRTAGVVLALAAGVWSVPLRAGETAGQAEPPPNWAHLAARADAAAGLAEQVAWLEVPPDSTVADFTGASPRAAAAVQALLAGLPEKSGPQTMEDGSCEVRVEISLDDLAAALKYIRGACAPESKIRAADLAKLAEANSARALVVTGVGTAPAGLRRPEAVPVRGGDYSSASKVTGKARALWKGVPRGRREAVQAARADARRRLGGMVGLVHLAEDLTIGEFIAASPRRDVDMARFLRGARETAVRYHDDMLVVEVEVSLSLRKVYMDLKGWSRGNVPDGDRRLRLIEDLIVKSEDTLIRAVGIATPPAGGAKAGGPAAAGLSALVADAPSWFMQKLRASADVADRSAAARRMAEIEARGRLAALVESLKINSKATVRDVADANEEFREALAVFLQSAGILAAGGRAASRPASGPASRPANPVTMAVDLAPLWNLILHHSDSVPRAGG